MKGNKYEKNNKDPLTNHVAGVALCCCLISPGDTTGETTN